MTLLIISIAVLFIILLLLILIKPNKYRDMECFKQYLIAHRGFFDNSSDCPENTLKAFEKAVNNNYGIELDVQMTLDEKLVVFHDKSLKRMCKLNKILTECSYDELLKYNVSNSTQKIPLFTDVLKLVDGKVPLIVEIKQEGDWFKTTQKTAEILDKYHGKYCIESFHPLIVQWYKKNRPEIIRGQLSSNFFKDGSHMNWFAKSILSNLFLNFLVKPDFIAYNYKYKNHFGFFLCRKIFKPTTVAWTIKTQESLNDAKKDFSILIFDSFKPI